MALDALNPPKGENEEENSDEKILILISSLLSWDATPKKLIEVRDPRVIEAELQAKAKERRQRIEKVLRRLKDERSARNKQILAKAEQASDDESPRIEEDDDEGDLREATAEIDKEDANRPPEKKVFQRSTKKMIHEAFTELDYEQRQCSDEYKSIREAEDLVLNFKKDNVKTYVIAAGVLYGMGESILNSHFEKAWKQEPQRLPIVGSGNNLVPTVHVTDLARMVRKVFESKPERKYIFGIDNTQKPTQKKLIQAISSGVGTGLVESVDIPIQFPTVHARQTPLKLDAYWERESKNGEKLA